MVWERIMDPVRASDLALADGIELMATWQSHHRTERSPAVLMTAGASRFPAPYSNALFPLESRPAEEIFGLAKAFFTDRRFVLWAQVERDRALIEAALERGFVALGDTPGMLIDARVSGDRPSALALESISSAAGLAELVHVCQEAYAEAGLPAEIGAKLFASAEAVLDGRATLALARLDGKAIGAALSLVTTESLGGVYWVATLPAARKQGAADAVTRLVTNAAFDRGARLVTLQASRAGEPIYRRMGYREVVRYERLLSPRPD
jgi:ribosomal protein S18 acetylase RimI-like enzyme